MLFPVRPPDDESLEGSKLSARRALRAAYRMDETACVRERAKLARLTPGEQSATMQLARELVTAVRARHAEGVLSARHSYGIEAFLRENGLDTREGIVLLCIAEALLRIPDAATAAHRFEPFMVFLRSGCLNPRRVRETQPVLHLQIERNGAEWA
jgi:hypothetical protein